MVYIPWTGYNPKSVDRKKKIDHNQQKILQKGGIKPAMASCFDIRTRATSFDLHNIGQGNKMSLLSKLFRSKSESHMKPGKKSPGSSPSTSPRGSPRASPGAPPRRRFARVVRDDQAVGEEYVNPHVVRKVTPGFWEKHHMRKSHSLDSSPERPLPYTVTGHTILKKHHSVDCDTPASDSSSNHSDSSRHAKFKEDVEVLEYDIKGKCLLIHSDSMVVHTKLHDDTLEECLEDDFCNLRSVESIDVISVEVEAKCTTLRVINETEDTAPCENVEDSDVQSDTSKDKTIDEENDSLSEESSAPKKSKVIQVEGHEEIASEKHDSQVTT